MTQRELARRLGVAATAVAKWELGQRDLPLDRLDRWADELGMTLRVELLEQARDNKPGIGVHQQHVLDVLTQVAPLLSDAEAATYATMLEAVTAGRRYP